jgi:hypothetical protein
MKYLLNGLTAIVLSFCIILVGCDYNTAKKANAVIGAVFALIQQDLPALESSGVVSPQAAKVIDTFVDLGVQSNGDLTVCLTKGNQAPDKKSAFLACYLAFSNGLQSSSELAALKVLAPNVEKFVQVWLAALDTAVVSAIIAFGGVVPTARATTAKANIAKAPSPEYKAFEKRVLAYANAHPVK